MEPDSISNTILPPATENLFIGGGITVGTIVALVVLLVLICFSAMVSGSEIAFFSLSPSKKDKISKSEKKSNKLITGLLTTPDKLLASILIANNFVNVGIVMLSTYIIHSLFDFSAFPVLGFIVEVVIITFLLLLFGEIIPKIYAGAYPVNIASIMAKPLAILQKAFSPLVWALTSSTAFINRHFDKQQKNDISIGDISQALDLTDERELSDDRTILKGIVSFGSTNVEQVMTPRTDVIAIDIDTPMSKVINTINNNGYSRMPVYTESFDNVNGILYIKDLLPHYQEIDTFDWKSILRPPYFVPENKKIDNLLEEFQKNKVHMAIVVDEYGGTSGIITLEDILEEIVGDINDELDDDETRLFSKINQNEFLFDGKILLVDFYRICSLNPDVFKNVKGEADTLAGLILEIKGEFPLMNECVKYGNIKFSITSIDKRRIKKIKVSIEKS